MFAKHVLVLGILLLAAQAAQADEVWPFLTVKEAKFSSLVVEKNKMYTNTLSERAKVGPLFLWTLIEGDEAALDSLQEKGKLPILHVWKRHFADQDDETMVEPRNESEKPLHVSRISLGVGAAKDIAGLKQEVKLREGRFDWRTWSKVPEMTSGSWSVEVTYADREAIQCDGKPCMFRIYLSP